MIALRDVIDFAEQELARKDIDDSAIYLVVIEDIDAARKQLARFERVREYVVNNLALWDGDDDPLPAAYADIYQKVLNVIDTGDPMRAIE